MESETPRVVKMQAPVLIIRKLLDEKFCKHLIDIWKVEGNEEGYTMVEDEDGNLRKTFNREYKVRRDHFLEEGETLDKLKQYTKEHVCPAVLTAFHFEITRFEDFRIGCYDSSTGGFFGPHRDNDTKGTAHRKFAMSVNLNTEKYEGGYLTFPKHGTDLYKVWTGDAVIFSGALLHEVTPVTKDRRFALISFLYGEQESEQRKEYYRQMALNAIDRSEGDPE